MSKLSTFISNISNKNDEYTAKELREIVLAKREKQLEEERATREKDEQTRLERKLFENRNYIKKLSLKELVGNVKREYTIHNSDVDCYDTYKCLPFVCVNTMPYGDLKEKVYELHKNIDSKSIYECDYTDVLILADLLEFINETEETKKHSDNEACFISHTSGLPFGFLRKNKKYIVRFLNKEMGIWEYDYIRVSCSISSMFDGTYLSLFANY